MLHDDDDNCEIDEDYDHIHTPQFLHPMNYHQDHNIVEYPHDWYDQRALQEDAFMDDEGGYYDSDANGMTEDFPWYPIWEEGAYRDEEWFHHYNSTQWEHDVAEHDRIVDGSEV